MNTFFSCKKLLLAVFSIIGLILLSGCGGGGSTPVTLNSIAVTPTSVTIIHGDTANLRAVGTYTDGSTVDLTSQAAWVSAAPTTAAVSSTGVVSGVTIGNTTVTATMNGITSPTASIAVTAATLRSIAVTPTSTSLAKGTNTPLTATGTYSDGSSADISTQVSWTSASPATATVGLNTGTVTGVAVGSTTAFASMNGLTSPDVNITVTAATLSSINITTGATLPKGTNTNLTATGIYSDGTTADLTTLVTWTSADPLTATVGINTGIVFGTAIGTTTVSAALRGITSSNSANINVIAATLSSIAVTPSSATLAKGTNTSLAATGTYSDGSSADISTQVSWTSADPLTATVGSHTGTVAGVAIGSTTVSASLSGITSSNSADITITAATLNSIAITTGATLPKGTTANLIATGTYSDGTTADITANVTWTSADPLTATVGSHTGSVVGTAIGTTTVTAALGGITSSNSANITVTAATLSSIAITPASVSLAKGTNTTLTATGTYSDASTADITTQVTWTSDAPGMASVGAHTGVVLTPAVGSANISASLDLVYAPSISVTVTPAVLTGIALAPSPVSLTIGTNTNLTATGTYSDNSTADITTQASWTSDAPATATVGSNTGIVTGVALGGTTVSATLDGITSPTVTITVTPIVYATWNPAAAGSHFSFSSDNLTATSPSTDSCRATIGISSGTAYWEVVIAQSGSGLVFTDAVIGIETSLSDLNMYVGSSAYGWGIYTLNGNIFNNGVNVPYGSAAPAGTVIGFGLDMTAGTLRIWLNGIDQGIAVSGLTGTTIYPATTGFVTGVTANFGATPFVYPQAGYKAGVY